MAYGFAAVCAPAIVLSPIFFRYWISPDFARVSAPDRANIPGMWMAGLSLVGFTLLQSQGRADLTGKLSMIEFLPFMGLLWALTVTFGIVGGGYGAWSFTLHGGRLGDNLGLWNEKEGPSSAAAPAALLVATLVVARFFLGSNILVDLLGAGFAASAAIALSLVFSEDWRAFMRSLVNRARLFAASLTTKAFRPGG